MCYITSSIIIIIQMPTFHINQFAIRSDNSIFIITNSPICFPRDLKLIRLIPPGSDQTSPLPSNI